VGSLPRLPAEADRPGNPIVLDCFNATGRTSAHVFRLFGGSLPGPTGWAKIGAPRSPGMACQ
jgi:hypothetical protein